MRRQHSSIMVLETIDRCKRVPDSTNALDMHVTSQTNPIPREIAVAVANHGCRQRGVPALPMAQDRGRGSHVVKSRERCIRQ
jgi:hypothetical protein